MESKVIDSRPSEDGSLIRRRRECLVCQKRFSTNEQIERTPLIVIKKDSTREPFDRSKVMGGIIKACEKRPVPMADIEAVVRDVETTLHNRMESECWSSEIGVLIMDHLKKLDDVAYVRFASVHREFKDLNTFMEELKYLMRNKRQRSVPSKDTRKP